MSSPRKGKGRSGKTGDLELLLSLRPALILLLDAFDLAEKAGCSHWEYAVPYEKLCVGDCTDSRLRWLVQSKYAEHGREKTRPTHKARAIEQQQAHYHYRF